MMTASSPRPSGPNRRAARTPPTAPRGRKAVVAGESRHGEATVAHARPGNQAAWQRRNPGRMRPAMVTPRSWVLAAARAVAGLLPDRLKAAIYRLPVVSGLVRWLLTRAAPGKPVVVEVAGGLARGLRLRLDLKTEKYFWLGTHEMPVQRALAREVQPGWTVYDIGAHVGFFTLALARQVGAGGRVLAFEPLPANLSVLRENLAMNPAVSANVQVIEAAVARESGRASLFAEVSTPMARLTAPPGRPGWSRWTSRAPKGWRWPGPGACSARPRPCS